MKFWDSTSAIYKRLLLALLPRGPYWRTDDAEPTVQLLAAVGQHLDHVHGQVYDLATAEAFPDTASLLLAEWEEALGLPEAGESLAASTAERRQVAMAKWLAAGGQTPAYFIELAAGLGLTVTIAEATYAPGFRAGAGRAGEPLGNHETAFEWFVTCTGVAGVPQPRLENLFLRLRPAHTIPHFDYPP